MTRLAIYGAGGFGREIVTAARDCGRNLVFVSDTPVATFHDIPIIRPDEIRVDDDLIIGIADPVARQRLAAQYSRFGVLVAPTSVIGNEVEIGGGSIFCDFSMVTASARIGRHFHCNIYSYVA